MASIALTAFALSVLLFQLTSCKKVNAQTTTNCPVATYQVAGLWTGTYSVTSLPSQGQLFYSFVIYKDNTLLTTSKGSDGKFYYSTGTWTLSNTNVFSGTIVSYMSSYSGLPVTQNITGTYSDAGTISNASWNDTKNPNGGPLAGQFSTMQRIN